jgi:hypothetical protein
MKCYTMIQMESLLPMSDTPYILVYCLGVRRFVSPLQRLQMTKITNSNQSHKSYRKYKSENENTPTMLKYFDFCELSIMGIYSQKILRLNLNF